MFFRLCVLVLYMLSFAAMAADFSKVLSDALLSKGVKQENVDKTLKALAENGIDNRDLLCLSTKEDLKKEVGLHFTTANVILDFCKPAKPVEVGVSDLAKLSVLNLLNRLATNSQDANALEALQSKSLVKKAQARTTAWAAVGIDENGKRTLDAQATLEYLKYLSLPTQPALLNKTRKGQLIESIDILGKVDGQILLHPLFDNQCITMGYDETRLDWSKVPSEVMKALLWARETGHSAFSRLNQDAARVYGEVAKEKIDDVFIQDIIKDYQLAIKRKDRRAMFTVLEPSSAQLAACKKKTLTNSSAPATTSRQVVADSQNPSKTFTNSIGMKFVLIEPQGRCEDCKGKLSTKIQQCARLNCRKAFYMGKYEVTQGQWKKVMGYNPSSLQFKHVVGANASSSKIGAMLFDNYPVETVSFNNVQGFLKKLNEMEKNKPSDKPYRLPTEQEWVFALQGGTDNELAFSGNELGQYGWFYDNSENSTHPVGQKKPTAYGLHDMLGNVMEWMCSFNASYDPVDRGCSSNYHNYVFRGDGYNSKNTSRSYHSTTSAAGNLGFRVVLPR